MIKTPTREDYLNYDGAHTHKLWMSCPENWKCPACHRSKFEILRWTTRSPNNVTPFGGWIAPLHRHHDHSANRGSFFARFTEEVICDQCNASDGSAKRKLNLPSDFSFSPEEISRFVKATPHDKHELYLDIALKIYKQIKTEPKPTRFFT
ncbi:hypothetical protein NPJ88_010605 [Halomonas elongata]|uniref:hypothetical protein n=1 Tax=Halomonas elongata TaxID=2746 RepID=UPI00255ACA4C|nr:hypothetical protein [Halomonas elongata]MDL4862786.1 hypothetical protein [Halomonas elongata]